MKRALGTLALAGLLVATTLTGVTLVGTEPAMGQQQCALATPEWPATDDTDARLNSLDLVDTTATISAMDSTAEESNGMRSFFVVVHADEPHLDDPVTRVVAEWTWYADETTSQTIYLEDDEVPVLEEGIDVYLLEKNGVGDSVEPYSECYEQVDVYRNQSSVNPYTGAEESATPTEEFDYSDGGGGGAIFETSTPGFGAAQAAGGVGLAGLAAYLFRRGGRS